MKKFTVSLLFCSSIVCTTISAQTAFTGMRNLTPLQFTADMGGGWNLGNTLDANPGGETVWGNPLTTQAMIDEVRAKGFKTLRIPTTWYTHLGPAPDYTINSTWLDRVEEIANYAFNNDMYVIINMHHDDYESGKTGSWLLPTYAKDSTVTDQLVKVWTQIAERFIDYSDYLIFETMNEPRAVGTPEEWNGGTAEGRDMVNKLNAAAVNAIRATGGNNATRYIMCPPYAAAGWSTPLNAFVIPNNDSLVIVSIHNYAPYAFCLQSPGVSTWGSASDKSAIDYDMTQYYNKFISKGRAVVLGEWGSIDKSNTSDRTVHADYYVKAAKLKQIPTVYWDNGFLGSGGLGIFNRSTLTWALPTIADAIVENYVTTVRGKEKLPANFALDQNYPNPFNPSTTIRYSIAQQGFVRLNVYDLLGKQVAALIHREQPEGHYTIDFNAASLPSGVYFYRLQSGNFTETKKLMLVR